MRIGTSMASATLSLQAFREKYSQGKNTLGYRIDPATVRPNDVLGPHELMAIAPFPRGFKECDPSGLDIHAPGAKADAGKLRPTLVLRDMCDAVLVVIKIATDGADKYSDGGWLKVENAPTRYEDADLRHMLKRFAGQAVDADSNSAHLGHEAWNALAKLQLFLNENPQYKVTL